MTIAMWTDELGLKSAAVSALKTSAGFWFLVAAAGPWAFLYLMAALTGAIARGHYALSGGMLTLALILAVGSVCAAIFLWRPVMARH